MNLADYLAAYINLAKKPADGTTDYGWCLAEIKRYFDLQTINMLCDAAGISTRQTKQRKVARLVETAFQFDADGAMLSTSTVTTQV